MAKPLETFMAVCDPENTAAEVRQAQQAIACGQESTGSRLHDGLIVLYGRWLFDNPDILANYERAQAELEGKAGQPVAVLKCWGSLAPGCYGFGQRPQYEQVEEVSYGRLNDDVMAFDYRKLVCSLPMPAHAVSGRKTRSPQLFSGGTGLSLAPGTVQPPLLRSPVDLGRHLQTAEPGIARGHEASVGYSATAAAPQLWLYAGQPAIDNWLISWPGHKYRETVEQLASKVG